MRKRHRAAGAFAGVLVALVVGTLPAAADHDLYRRISSGVINGNGPLNAGFAGVSADGTCAFFHTYEGLVLGDTDGSFDIYRRCKGLTTRVSVGAINGNGPHEARFLGSSTDGSRVLFETAERLVSADTDTKVDIYQRYGGVTTRVSAGNGNFDAQFRGHASNAAHIFYETYERLVGTDTDIRIDLYEHFGTTTRVVSVGQINGNGPYEAFLRGVSADGSRVYFVTKEKLVPDDTDAQPDIYRRTVGSFTTRVSGGVINGNGAFPVDMVGMAGDATHVFIETSERLVLGDTDDALDVYVLTGGTTGRISVGTIDGNGAYESHFAGSSADGTCAVFETEERLVPGDTDAVIDIYRRCGSQTDRASKGEMNGNGALHSYFRHVSADGNCVTFTTAERLLVNDTDTQWDIYQRCGSTTVRVSTGVINGNGSHHSGFEFASPDGRRVFFETAERLVSADTDSALDVYERAFATTTRVSAGAMNGNGAFPVEFAGASRNGKAVYFQSFERLVIGDTDSSLDVYGVFVTP